MELDWTQHTHTPALEVLSALFMWENPTVFCKCGDRDAKGQSLPLQRTGLQSFLLGEPTPKDRARHPTPMARLYPQEVEATPFQDSSRGSGTLEPALPMGPTPQGCPKLFLGIQYVSPMNGLPVCIQYHIYSSWKPMKWNPVGSEGEM